MNEVARKGRPCSELRLDYVCANEAHVAVLHMAIMIWKVRQAPTSRPRLVQENYNFFHTCAFTLIRKLYHTCNLRTRPNYSLSLNNPSRPPRNPTYRSQNPHLHSLTTPSPHKPQTRPKHRRGRDPHHAIQDLRLPLRL